MKKAAGKFSDSLKTPRPESEPYSLDQGFEQRPGDNRFSEPKHRMVQSDALKRVQEKAPDDRDKPADLKNRNVEPPEETSGG